MTETSHPDTAAVAEPAPPYPTPLPPLYQNRPFRDLPVRFQGHVLAALAALSDTAENGHYPGA